MELKTLYHGLAAPVMGMGWGDGEKFQLLPGAGIPYELRLIGLHMHTRTHTNTLVIP